jgi:hypothetical protein
LDATSISGDAGGESADAWLRRGGTGGKRRRSDDVPFGGSADGIRARELLCRLLKMAPTAELYRELRVRGMLPLWPAPPRMAPPPRSSFAQTQQSLLSPPPPPLLWRGGAACIVLPRRRPALILAPPPMFPRRPPLLIRPPQHDSSA